jgi:hypothetical protein
LLFVVVAAVAAAVSDVFCGASKAGGRIELVKRQDRGDNLRMRGGDWRGGR